MALGSIRCQSSRMLLVASAQRNHVFNNKRESREANDNAQIRQSGG